METTLSRHLAAKDIFILHEDEAILVINKPAPFLVLPDRYDEELPNLFSLLNELYGKIYAIHRLDKETSGVIIFAKTSEAHALLSEQFSKHTVQKTYHAIVIGVMNQTEGRIELPVAEGVRGKMRIDVHSGKASVTEYKTLEQFKGFSFIEVQPRTGRTHQIRLHLNAKGVPILCDELYGGGKQFFLSSIKAGYKYTKEEERPLLSRTALHAASITFIHPTSKETVTFSTPLPKDMNTALKYLRKFRT